MRVRERKSAQPRGLCLPTTEVLLKPKTTQVLPHMQAHFAKWEPAPFEMISFFRSWEGKAQDGAGGRPGVSGRTQKGSRWGHSVRGQVRF